ncbi:recombinase family protein [Stappia stellulata]|uniref:recombinase family protein n=1 Tax=Stappia stellulata TaxID=71235 RepID=UPI001CD1CC41|nr:recombinase family protein [Stappia stellulata]MCA1241474.1 recombinase family protein [Stappia stellulata]
MKKLGYLRISTHEQRPDRQIDGLHGLCDELHIETLSAVSAHRPVFDTLLSRLTTGDRLIVWDLDRAFRSTIDAIVTAEALRERGVGFQVATLMIDTETPAGEYTYTIMAATAQFERRNLAKRTREGMEAARRRGVRLGRPPLLSHDQVEDARRRIDAGLADAATLATEFGVSRWTVERAVRPQG